MPMLDDPCWLFSHTSSSVPRPTHLALVSAEPPQSGRSIAQSESESESDSELESSASLSPPPPEGGGPFSLSSSKMPSRERACTKVRKAMSENTRDTKA